MKSLQWHTFEKKIYINSTIKKLYDLWSTKAGITSWFLRDAQYVDKNGAKRKDNEHIQVGDTYTWYWHNWDGKADGEILEANGKNNIVFSFEESKVSVNFEEKNGVIILSLKQFEIPEDDENKLRIHFGCSNG